MAKRKIIIMGAAGRDFHNFNVYYRNNEERKVVAFTAAQIPNISDRRYPASLAGHLYPEGIPIHLEEELPELIKKYEADEVVFAYSDISHTSLMNKASTVLAAGADFDLLSPKSTMLKSKIPVISVCAVRTGCGKSQTTRRVCDILKDKGHKVVAIRHPMPYGELEKQVVQRYETYEDLDKHDCTIEEREEYEPHIDKGIIVYAGVDYGAILEEAEKEADIIVWDGGNNDTSFYVPDLHIVIADPHRPGHELSYYAGETNLRMANVVIINKVTTADPDKVDIVWDNIRSVNPNAQIIKAASPITVDNEDLIRDKTVLVVEDGPTLTHGEMTYGAGAVAAKQYGAFEQVDPKPYAVGSILETFEKYPHIKNFLPAMGYNDTQISELEKTINDTPCDIVVSGTPIDLNRVINVNKPIIRVFYTLEEISKPDLEEILADF